MNRGMIGIAAALSLCAAAQSVDAQVYVYRAPAVVYVPRADSAPAVVTSNYYAPAYATPTRVSRDRVATPGIVQMNYNAPTTVPERMVFTDPYSGGVVRQTTRGGPLNYTQTTRTYGPVDGPRFSRVHVHRGLFGATVVRETVR